MAVVVSLFLVKRLLQGVERVLYRCGGIFGKFQIVMVKVCVLVEVCETVVEISNLQI